MERKLIISNDSFPTDFNKIDVTPPSGLTKQQHIEQSILSCINNYNPKLEVTCIIYDNLAVQFSHVKSGKYTGAIVEDLEIENSLEETYKNKGYYTFKTETQTYARRILLYVFMSPADESGRNGFVSQTIFPTILDYMENNLDSPSYTIAEHKFLFINIINKQITANMILRHIAGMYLIGVDYIETFTNSIDVKSLPKDILEFLKLFDTDFHSNYDALSKIYENDYYKIIFSNKKFIIKANKLIADTITINGRTDFKGSSEKFYWIEVYPLVILAYNLGYSIDYSEYTNYCTSYRTRFSTRSEKFSRCETLLKYFKKYMMN